MVRTKMDGMAETDENAEYSMSTIFDMLSVAEKNLFELSVDISMFDDLIASAKEKDARGFETKAFADDRRQEPAPRPQGFIALPTGSLSTHACHERATTRRWTSRMRRPSTRCSMPARLRVWPATTIPTRVPIAPGEP